MDVQKIDLLPGLQDRIGRAVCILPARHIVNIGRSVHIDDPHVIDRRISNDRAAVHMILPIEENSLRCHIFQSARSQLRDMQMIHHILLQICMRLIVLFIHDAGKLKVRIHIDCFRRLDHTELAKNRLCEGSLIGHPVEVCL